MAKQSSYSNIESEPDFSNLINNYIGAEEASSVSHQDRYSALLQTVKDWVWEVDTDIIITYAGPQVYDILGYLPEELVGTSPFELMDKEEGERVRKIFTKKFRDRKSCHLLENVCRHKDGTPRIIATSALPVFESNGTFRGYVGTDRDITEQRIAEQKLRETQAKLENLVSNLPGMAYRYTNDENTTLQFASFGCKALLAYEPDQLTVLRQVSFEKLVHPDDRKRIRAEINNAISRGKPYNLVYRLITAEQSVKWVTDKGRKIQSFDGTPDTLEGFIVDDTDRLEAMQSIELDTMQSSQEIERQLELSESLKNVMSVINSSRFVHETLAYITRESVNQLAAESAICLYQKEHADDVEVVANVNFHRLDKELAVQLIQWIQDGINLNGSPTVIEGRDQLDQDDFSKTALLKIMDSHGYQSCLLIPMATSDPPHGGLILFYRVKTFTPEELELAQLLSKQMELAIESGRLRTLATDAAIIEERKRLARELHDSVTQLLCSLTLYSESARRFLDKNDNRSLAECIKQISLSTRQALSEMRLLVYELHPETTDMGNLLEVLTRRLQAVEARSGIKTKLDFQAEGDIPDVVRTTLIKVSQEAMNNIIKHAKADSIEIQINQSDKRIEMSIIDDGCGFDLEDSYNYRGLGIRSMREQISKLGGEFIIETSPGRGAALGAIIEFE